MPANNHHRLSERKVLVLLGPTASGKTAISLLLARSMNAEILSADSRQVYRCLDIGTAKPTAAERDLVPHHFVDVIDPEYPFNAGEFGKQGREVIDEIFARGNVPIVVGGSGLYLRGLIDGFFEGPGADQSLREELYKRLHDIGGEGLLEDLRVLDPAAASRMLPTNTRRIIRALEIVTLTGRPISELQKEKITISFDPVFAGLQWDRKELYHRIDERVDRMIDEGLVNEVFALKRKGYTPRYNALQTTGYVEVFDFIDGKISFEEMVRLMKRNTRRYAKRQMTWFRQDTRIRWFKVESEAQFPLTARAIISFFQDTKKRRSL